MRKHGRKGQRTDGLPNWAAGEAARSAVRLQFRSERQTFHWHIQPAAARSSSILRGGVR